MNKLLLKGLSLSMLVIGIFATSATEAANLTTRLRGRILLAVQDNGEAWYVNPINNQRYFMGRPADAFQLMRTLGLGISNKTFASYRGKAPVKLSGRILIKTEDLGKAYYVNPGDLKLYYLGTPADAFKLMRNLSLGISNSDLDKVAVNISSALVQVASQDVTSGKLFIKKIISPVNGWIAIHKSYNGQPGDVIIYARIKAGVTTNLSLDLSVNDSQDLFAMLHTDTGTIGSFGFPNEDAPVMINNKPVMTEFHVTYNTAKTWNVYMSGFNFNPSSLTISKGDTVTWTNNDMVIHTVTSGGNFDSGDIASGHTYSRVFNAPGTFVYHCSIHPNMTGTIIVR